jgi:hypothetical protein
MNTILEELRIYLELYDIPRTHINKILKRDDVQLYSYLKNKLTHGESMELSSILDEFVSKKKEEIITKKIDPSKFIQITEKDLKHVKKIFNISENEPNTTIVKLMTILSLEPIDIANNYLLFN